MIINGGHGPDDCKGDLTLPAEDQRLLSSGPCNGPPDRQIYLNQPSFRVAHLTSLLFGHVHLVYLI